MLGVPIIRTRVLESILESPVLGNYHVGAADAGLGTYRLEKGPGSTSEQEMASVC